MKSENSIVYREIEGVSSHIPTKACMHVLGVARTDIRVMRSAVALTEAGFDVTIIDVDENIRPPMEEIQHVCLKHIRMPTSFFATRFRTFPLVRAFRLFALGVQQLLRTPADIYHAHDMTALPACYIAARIRQKPLIFDAHELPLSELAGTKRRLLRLLLTVPLSMMIKRSTKILTTSPGCAREIERRYHIEHVSLLRNFPLYQSVAKSERLRQRLDLNSCVRIALYQGNIQPDRGLDRLVYAAKYLEQDTVIVLMGKGTPETLTQLHKLIASEGVADRVKIIPAVPYEELLDWTASADIGLNLLPPDYSMSIRLCLPNKLFEYMMAGLPVLTADLEAVVEVVRTYEVGAVLTSLEPSAIGDAINMLLHDKNALARMRSNALKAAQEFCWEKEYPRLVAFYQETLERHVQHITR